MNYPIETGPLCWRATSGSGGERQAACGVMGLWSKPAQLGHGSRAARPRRDVRFDVHFGSSYDRDIVAM